MCIDLRSDKTIRETANAKNDTKMLALVSRDIVAAEACYHRSCYRDYTRPAKSTFTSSKSSLDDEYAQVESSAYEMLFDYIFFKFFNFISSLKLFTFRLHTD